VVSNFPHSEDSSSDRQLSLFERQPEVLVHEMPSQLRVAAVLKDLAAEETSEGVVAAVNDDLSDKRVDPADDGAVKVHEHVVANVVAVPGHFGTDGAPEPVAQSDHHATVLGYDHVSQLFQLMAI
jgi:hypothetical protein